MTGASIRVNGHGFCPLALLACLSLLCGGVACASDQADDTPLTDTSSGTAGTAGSPVTSSSTGATSGAASNAASGATSANTATTSFETAGDAVASTGTTAAANTAQGSDMTGVGGATANGSNDAAVSDGASITTSATGSGGATTSAATTAGASSTGGTVTYVPGDYVSRKWARWPIANPPSLNLPNPMSYSTTADGVLDEVTGLTWQANTNSNTTNWQDALAYCEGLGAGWSLPTRIELSSIVDNTVSGAKWDQGSFSGSAGWTWAATPWVVNERRGLTGSAALSWFINFAVGDSNNSLSQTATSAYSRCVKLPASRELPQEHYSVTDLIVTDNYTGLTWQRAHSADTPTLTFEQALSYCEALELEGGGFRLPSLNELASLVDDVPSGDVSPATDHDVFPDTAPDALYWSVSSYGTDTSEHWTLNFEDGFTAHDANATAGIARCVR